MILNEIQGNQANEYIEVLNMLVVEFFIRFIVDRAVFGPRLSRWHQVDSFTIS